MKTILGWLGDPYLHLVAIGAILVAVGSGLGTDKAAADDLAAKCDFCHKIHDDAKPCTHLIQPAPHAAD